MCGIAGGEAVAELVERLDHRGSSARVEDGLGHVLHPVVNQVAQPLEREGRIVANCEIYNWRELAEQEGIDAANDADLLLALLDEHGADALDMVDGVYAFVYERDGILLLSRDLLGVKPLWYATGPFAFASERQALEGVGREPRQLHPRHLLRVDGETVTATFRDAFFEPDVDGAMEMGDAAGTVAARLRDAVAKRIPDEPVALLFSGGVDSVVLAVLLQEMDAEFTAYTAGVRFGNVDAPRDVEAARAAAEALGIPHETVMLDIEDVERLVPDIIGSVADTSAVTVGVAATLHAALERAEERVAFSGLGAEQLYGGYARQVRDLDLEGQWGLRGLFHRDLERDDVVAMRNGAELRLPFLDTALVRHALTVPDDLKVRDETRKAVLREAAERCGVPANLARRRKRAAQYGSNMDKALDRLAKDAGTGKQAYLNRFRNAPNHRVAALFSGGKDSNAAVHRMRERNAEVTCLVNLQSANPDSYMFDAKDRDVVARQAERLDIPLLVQETAGEKEAELADLEAALERAREEHGVDGVVSGALASAYQRDRVERVADRVGLKTFSPLWGQDPAGYMRWLVREGFQVEITETKARGLDGWDGTVLDVENVEELIALADAHGFHPAAEGGGFETVVTGLPDGS